MAASSGFTGAHSSTDADDDDFGSFAAAERLSDPFGDVYGADADFGDFEAPSTADNSSSLMSFSPVTVPATTIAPPTLLPSISGEIDPFADITGGLGAATDVEGSSMETTGNAGRAATSGADTTTSTSTSYVGDLGLGLGWGNSKQDTETNVLSMSSTSVSSASAAVSRTASTPNGFSLPPPPSTKFATFPSASASTPEASTGDLLSFSPVQASAPSDPFFGISNDTSEATPTFGNDDLFTLTATPPLSTTSSSAPTSLRGSFASLHEEMKPPVLSPSTPESVEVAHDPCAERTTRSFGSLSSSFVSVGAMDDTARNGAHASFSTFTSATHEVNTTIVVTPSPSSAPPSLRSSFKMTDGFMGFATTADESDEIDPFAEAGLAAPEEIPLAEALAAWSTNAEPDEQEDDKGDHEKPEEEDGTEKHDAAAGGDLIDDVGTSGERRNDLDVIGQTELAEPADTDANSLDAWQSVDTASSVVTERTGQDVFDCSFTKDQQVSSAPIDATVTSVESESVEAFEFAPLTESINPVKDDKNVADKIADDRDTEINSLGLQDNAFDDDNSNSDEDDDPVAADEIVWPEQQSSAEVKEDFLEMGKSDTLPFTTPTTDASFESVDDVSDETASLHYDVPTATPVDLVGSVNECNEDFAPEGTKKEDQVQKTEVNSGDFGDFGGFAVAAPLPGTATIASGVTPWGPSPSPTPVQNMLVEDEDNEFGDFAVSKPSATVEDDGFADFAHSTEPSGDDSFGDFGDFEQSNGDDFMDFQHSSADAFGNDNNNFGDFTPAIAPSPVTTATLPVLTFSKSELSAFFNGAFSTEPLPAISLDQPESPINARDADTIQEASTDFIEDVFRSMWNEFIAIVAATGCQSPPSSSGSLSPVPESTDSGERVRLGRKTTRASKYLKYVLSEKIQEASRQNEIFSHGSEKHQMYVGFVASGDADRMRAALKELQDALFHNSVNDAMMRIAKQAALSAKAKIAEQAAQQQASSRGGSLFSTTRHLLSRGGGAGGAHGPSSSGNDSKADHAGADTPTGASVQKLARFSFANNHEDSANGNHGANNGDERGSEGSDHTSGSDSEMTGSAGDSRTRSQTLSNSGSSSGGLMKKFQDRFSFASSRHRPRLVSLRRKGQSSEEVRKMELNLDSISGGLDEVKWKCAMFLYDVEEVAHVAPSQISIVAYPSKQPLTGKTDRSALTKLVKPDTIWTVDIGANNSDMLNEW
ncbi:LOW QUALITY PROTEIN: hypothetical protein PHPALM_31737 [Phytophthora palmivora]|uniref:Uncharacterized protein n=1 Tax=Phytophthora palmivora TaxID=4796 RepID=A0A2P4X1T9_9STRA|nr:LOW QUALITY PROTEIN: hypothetical protein PHPALM_31737 [Phytophthora palmivora]